MKDQQFQLLVCRLRDYCKTTSFNLGVHTIHALEPKSFSGMIENACELAKKEGIVKKGDYVVVTAGAPIGVSGSTNNLKDCKN